MLDLKLEAALKQYLKKLDLTIVYVNEFMSRFTRTINFLFKQLKKNKNDAETIYLIKEIFAYLSTFYVFENNDISFNYDIKSSEENSNLSLYENTAAFFKSDELFKYQLVGFDCFKVLNLQLLKQNLIDFHTKYQNKNKITVNFYKHYFLFLKSNNLKISAETIEIFCEYFLKKLIIRFYSKKFINGHKLNIWHI